MKKFKILLTGLFLMACFNCAISLEKNLNTQQQNNIQTNLPQKNNTVQIKKTYPPATLVFQKDKKLTTQEIANIIKEIVGPNRVKVEGKEITIENITDQENEKIIEKMKNVVDKESKKTLENLKNNL